MAAYGEGDGHASSRENPASRGLSREVFSAVRFGDARFPPSSAGSFDIQNAEAALVLQNSHSLPHALQHFQCLLQLFPRVRRRHDGAYARFSFRHGRESNASAKHTFFEQFPGEVHGQLAVANDDRSDGSFAGWGGFAANIKSQ